MPPQRGNDASVAGISDGIRQVAVEFRELEAPVTRSVVVIISVVFIGQIFTALLLEVEIPVLVRDLFTEYAAVAWVVSPVLHYGELHFLFNIVVIWGLGTVVEQTLSGRTYVLFILLAAIGSTTASYLAKAPFGPVQIATYGSSGIAYAAATYSLTFTSNGTVPGLQDLASVDFIARIAGFSAVLIVAGDIVAGPSVTANWFNGSHLGGAVIGLVCGRYLPETE